MERCADLVSVFFGTYGGTLCRSAIWFWDSSVLIVVRCADLVPVFFDIYGGTLSRAAAGGGVITTWAAGDGVIAAGPAV